MPRPRSPTLSLRASGPLACFTRPELKVERVSYPVMTPSAARGLIEAVLWRPAMRWHIQRIKVLRPIAFTAFRRNEVNTRAAVPAAAVVRKGGTPPVLLADADRAQRNTVALRDVDYQVDAYFSLTERAQEDDTVTKFVAMFERRLRKGQHFHQPYLGCREFAARVSPAEGAVRPIQDSRDLGLMLWDIEYGEGGNRALFFAAQLVDGVLEVPARGEVLAEYARRGGAA
jgi:CRISPR-associated protein Cas5d